MHNGTTKQFYNLERPKIKHKSRIHSLWYAQKIYALVPVKTDRTVTYNIKFTANLCFSKMEIKFNDTTRENSTPNKTSNSRI